MGKYHKGGYKKKKQLSPAQLEALKKGREARLAKIKGEDAVIPVEDTSVPVDNIVSVKEPDPVAKNEHDMNMRRESIRELENMLHSSSNRGSSFRLKKHRMPRV